MGSAMQLGALAHAGGANASETGQLVFTIMLLTVLAVVWILLGVVCWIFWRAKKRDDVLAADARSAHLGTGAEEAGKT